MSSMELRRTLLFFCILANISLIYSITTKFSSPGATIVLNGDVFTGDVLFDGPSNAQQITYLFAGSKTCVESEFYLNNARYQVCDASTCNGYYITLGTPAYDLKNPTTGSPLTASGSAVNIAGIGSCTPYTYTQDGTTVKIWVLSTNSARICQVSQVSSSFSRLITFTTFNSYSGTLSKPSNTQYPGCATSVQCGSAMDLVLVIDQSGSIDTNEFKDEMDYVRTVASSFVMGELGVKIGYVLFSSQPNVTRHLTADQSDLLWAINHTVQQGGETNIGDAIAAAHNLFSEGRSSAPNIILLLTDGIANLPDFSVTGVTPGEYALNKSNIAKNAGDIIFGVGVGTGVGAALATYTSGPNYLLSVTDFTQLQNTLNTILATICTSDTDSCVSSSLNCNSEEFCGCGECICTIDASSCGSRGTFNAAKCQCDCIGNWKNQNGDLTCSTCGITNSNCSSHGTVNATCECACDPNWGGASCSLCTKTCPTNANVINCATCQCKDFWNGTDCSTCDTSRCNPPKGSITNPATCNQCTCNNSWTEISNCASCGWSCNGHGTVSANCDGCSCSPNWTGPNCASCTLTNASCNNLGTPKSSCDGCTCTNSNAFGGTWCDTCKSSYCKNGATQGAYPNCDSCTCKPGTSWNGPTCNNCPITCSNGGTKNGNCTGCDCSPPWGGATCTVCNLDCGPHGHVTDSAACAGCTCDDGWQNSQSGYCNVCVPSLCNYRGTANASCNGCACFNTSMATGTFCENCDSSKCHNYGYPNDACSSCICNHGYTGNQCDTCSKTNYAVVSVPCLSEGLTDNSNDAVKNCYPIIYNSQVIGKLCFSTLGDMLFMTPYFDATLSGPITLSSARFVSTTNPQTANDWQQNSYASLNAALNSAPGLANNNNIAKSNDGKATPGPTFTVLSSGVNADFYVGVRLRISTYGSNNLYVFSSQVSGSRVIPLTVNTCTDCICNYDCHSHGTPNYLDCTQGCNCVDSWTGLGCNSCDTSARSPCNNHGHIIYNSTDDSCNQCTCDQYWEGATCTQCKYPCQNLGTPITPGCSSCNCPSPWNGTDCSSCDFNNLCNGHGTNIDANCNSCTCQNNWDPATNCKTCKLDCNGRGTPDKDCNVCECSSPIYSGATCTECVESVLCNGKGTINETAAFCTDCNCTEPTVWGGNRCNQCLFECNSPNGTPVETCDSCDCHGAWGASDCSVCDRSINSTYCTGRGTVSNAACDVCTCTQRWSGNTCNQCTFSCNGHGSPNPECTACNCTAGTEFTVASDCKTCGMECFNGGKPNAACTSCDCVNGWGGKYCSDCVTLPSECVHEDPNASPVVIIDTCICVCADAWVGRLCNECPIPSGGCTYPNGFVYHPDNSTCVCSCNNHFSGVDCSECVFECDSNRIMEVSDCSCHCPKYFKDDETCQTCILTKDDCVHPADPVTVDMTTCNCKCLGGWGDRDCSVCTLDPNGAPLGYAFNETSCEYYILCGNGIVNNPPEECEDSDANGNLVKYPECCDECHYNTIPCNDNNACTTNDKCYLGTCMGFAEFDWTLDPSRAAIPIGTPISTSLFAEWGLSLITLSTSDSLIFVDATSPGTGRGNLKLPSDNAFGGDNDFPRVVALQTPNDGDICVFMNPPLTLGAITVVGAYEQNTFVSTFCGNGSEYNKPVSTYSTPTSASVEYFELQCGSAGVSRVCIMNAKHAALGPIFMACDDVQPSATSTIGDYVWYDYNMNGLQDEDASSGVPGVSVTLLNKDGQVLRTTTTNQDGLYLFPNLYAGYYSVKFVIPETLHFTTSLNLGNNYWIGTTDVFTLGSNQTDLTRDAGVIYLGAIGDYVWYDLDENGIQDGNLVGVAGVTMNLYYSDNLSTVIKTTQTDNQGFYHFTGLKVEQSKGVYYNYIVELVPPTRSSVTKPFQGSSTLSDSNFNPIAPHLSNVVTLTPSSLVDNTIDGGIYYCCGSIGDKVWYDTDKDGLQNGEAGAPGVNVFLSWNGKVIDSKTTANDGSYLFTGLSLSGEYRVFFERPTGRYIFTNKGANNGNSPATDSNPDKNGYTDTIVLTVQNPDDLTIDAGLVDGCTTASDCASDANPCQTASCVANVCQFTPKTVCPVSTEPCANNVCNPVTGACSLVPKNITCSDNNPCTTNDKCTVSGCVGEPNDSLSCTDGNSCTDDVCFGGLCVSSPKNCSNSVGPVGQCQTPTCGSTGCTIVNVTDNTPCNDGLKCTTGDVCRNGLCSGTPVTCGSGDQCSTIACNTNSGECETTYKTNSNCNDNDACTEGDKCTATGLCAGTPKNCSGTSVPQCYVPVCSGGVCVPVFQQIPCSDGNPCTVDSCNPKSKLCESIATNCTNPGPCKRSYCSATTGKCVVENDDSQTCSDNDPCTTDRCSAGKCVSTEKTCTSTNPCKYSYCVNGACVDQNNAENCNDNNPCTTNDVCTNGVCYGTPIVCEDNNTCTSNTCVNGTCVFTPLSGVTCDDHSKCTKNSVCVSGECKGYDPVVCNDGNVCTTDSCNEETGECQYIQNAANCTLADKCLKDGICQFGQCVGVPVSCDLPHNQCVLSVCLNNQCQYQPDPSKQNSTCDDGLVCTEHDTCNNGVCAGTPVVCEKLNVCYDYHCDPVNGCVSTPNTAKCDDSNACTYNDVCGNGVCAGTPVNCEDGDVCTNNYCESGICKFNYTTNTCSDNNACTTGDTCTSGLCVGIPVVCGDGNICTDEVCNPSTGNCDVSFHNGISCSDQNACTSGDVCLNGACVGSPKVCSGSNVCMEYSCNSLNGTCEEKPLSTRRNCNDNNRCTIVDICVEGACVGRPVVCPAPAHSCESWSCNGDTGVCEKQLLSGNTCSDGNACTSGDVCVQGECKGQVIDGCGDNCEATCTPLNPCFTAACVANQCVQTPKSCQANSTCVEYACNIASGQCEARYPSNLCNDNNSCTQLDICVEGVCVGTNEKTCTATAKCTTQQCNPSTGNCDVQSVNDGTTTCDDTNKCTINDICTESGECSGTPMNCNDNNPCTDDSCSNGVCVHINNNNKCEDGNACTQNDTCASGSCVSGSLLDCSDGSVCTEDFCKDGVCIHEAIPGTRSCNDNSLCTENDLCFGVVCEGTPLDCNDHNECTVDSCRNGVCIHDNLADGTSCDDSDICTTGDQCVSGKCNGAPKCVGDSVCQSSECNAANGECVTLYHDGVSCEAEPGFCTTNTHEGRCTQGECVLPPRDCNDNNVCTDDFCDPASGCVHTDSFATCIPENGDLCSVYACVLGECALVEENDCNDNNPCTVDSCSPEGECVNTPTAGGSCSDNDECTINDVCLSDGSCKGVPRSCNDGNICTDDSCVSTSTAPFWGCAHNPVNQDLQCQLDRCTNGTCINGVCQGSISIVDCPAQACKTVSCASTTGKCVYENSDDSSLCPAQNCKVASCANGGCVYNTNNCTAQNALNTNLCTQFICQNNNQCVERARTNGTSCGDSNKCTSAVCKSGSCNVQTTNCTDKDLCTYNERCDLKDGCLSTPYSCLLSPCIYYSCNDRGSCNVNSQVKTFSEKLYVVFNDDKHSQLLAYSISNLTSPNYVIDYPESNYIYSLAIQPHSGVVYANVNRTSVCTIPRNTTTQNLRNTFNSAKLGLAASADDISLRPEFVSTQKAYDYDIYVTDATLTKDQRHGTVYNENQVVQGSYSYPFNDKYLAWEPHGDFYFRFVVGIGETVFSVTSVYPDDGIITLCSGQVHSLWEMDKTTVIGLDISYSGLLFVGTVYPTKMFVVSVDFEKRSCAMTALELGALPVGLTFATFAVDDTVCPSATTLPPPVNPPPPPPGPPPVNPPPPGRPPVNPPPGPVAHVNNGNGGLSGGSGGGNVAPGEDSNIVLTGATGNATTGVVGGVSVALIGACMIFGAILALNSTKEKQPDNLVGVLATEEVSGVAMENPTYAPGVGAFTNNLNAAG